MHPVIRLVCFMMLSLALAVGGWLHLLLGALVAAVLFARAGAAAWVTIMPMMRRMRWLWLSLVVIYFWFTPGVERPHTRWTRWGDRVASLFCTAVSRAETASCDEMELSPRPAPPLRQWLWPVALGAVMLAAAAVMR